MANFNPAQFGATAINQVSTPVALPKSGATIAPVSLPKSGTTPIVQPVSKAVLPSATQKVATPAFNPASFGAVAVTTPDPIKSAPINNAKANPLDSSTTIAGQLAKISPSDMLHNSVQGIGKFFSTLGNNLYDIYKNTPTNIKNNVEEGSSDFSKAQQEGITTKTGVVDALKGVQSAGWETALNAGNALFAPVIAGFKTITDILSDPNNPDVQAFASSSAPIVKNTLNAVQKATDVATKLAKNHPEVARTVSDAANTLMLLLGSKGLDENVDTEWSNTVKSVSDLSKTLNGTPGTPEDVNIPAKAISTGAPIDQGDAGFKENAVRQLTEEGQKEFLKNNVVSPEFKGNTELTKPFNDYIDSLGKKELNDVYNESGGKITPGSKLEMADTLNKLDLSGVKTANQLKDILTKTFGEDATNIEKNPDLMRHFQSMVNNIKDVTPENIIPATEPTKGILSEMGGGIKTAAEKAGTATKAVAEKIGEKVGSTVKSATEGTKDVLSGVKQGIKPTLTPEEATGQIIQGKTNDIPAALRTFKSLDTVDGIKTAKDLQVKLKSEIKPLAQKVDAELAKDPTLRPLSTFEKTVGEGANTTKINYVKEAINNLKELYTKTSDAQGLAKIKDIETKVNGLRDTTGKILKNGVGLSNKDVNDLSRLYNTEFGTKAFSKTTGDPLTSVNAQKFENIRTGLKETARGGLGGDAAKQLDSKLSDLFDTKKLVDKVVEKVNAAAQKIPKQGVIPKVIGKAINAVDVISGSPLKALGKAMGNLGSNGALNPVELESNLVRNLKTIRAKI